MCEKKEFNYSKLRGRMVEVYGTIEKTAEAAGIRRDMISLALNGKRAFTQQEISRLSETLKIPEEEIGTYFFRQ
jgi:antitoxin component HigA of HigAB toxin-antitoxin module